jgi:hypothetical protein
MRQRGIALLLALVAVAALATTMSARPAEAAGGCTPSAHFELDAYGYVNVSHRAYCGYAKWYGTIIVQHGLKVNGKPVVWPDSGAVYRGPTTGGWFSGYGTRARNTAGTQQFCAWTKVTWQYTSNGGGQKYGTFCASY